MKMFQIYPYDANRDIMGQRHWTKWMSALVLALSIGTLIFVGPRWGIDFQGGTEILVQFEEQVDDAEVREAAESLGLRDQSPLVQRFGSDDDHQFMVQVRDVSVVHDDDYERMMEQFEALEGHQQTDPIDEQPERMALHFEAGGVEDSIREAVEEAGVEHLRSISEIEGADPGEFWYEVRFLDFQEMVEDGLSEYFDDTFSKDDGVQRLESVGPRAGEQLRNDGALAMIVALFFILVYIWVRFDERYSPGAVAALAHDITIALGLFILLDIEFSLPIVAALLTIIGYSLNDTIVVFDRIRENLDLAGPDQDVVDVANEAINQTMSRTLVTSLTTLMAVTCIAFIATGLIEDFAKALMVGIVVGTYSSVFVASPVMLKMDTFLEERRKEKALLDEQYEEDVADEPQPEGDV